MTCNLDNSLCIAVGLTPVPGKRQIIAKRDKQNNEWTVSYFNMRTQLGMDLDFPNQCCTGNSKNSLCVVTSNDPIFSLVSTHLMTNDFGATWKVLSGLGKASALDCDYDGTFARAWFKETFDNFTNYSKCLIRYTNNSGKSWESILINCDENKQK